MYERLSKIVKQNFDALEEAFKKYFRKTKLPPVRAYEKAYQIKKGSDSVQTFYEKIQEKIDHLDMTQDQQMALFINGLPKFIKRHILLQQALQIAKEEELIGSDDEEDTKSMLKQLIKKMNNQKPEPAKVAAMSSPDPHCTFCGAVNHFARFCSHKEPESKRVHFKEDARGQVDVYVARRSI